MSSALDEIFGKFDSEPAPESGPVEIDPAEAREEVHAALERGFERRQQAGPILIGPDESGSMTPDQAAEAVASLAEAAHQALGAAEDCSKEEIVITDGEGLAGRTAGDDLYPDLGGLTTTKVPHKNLILEGVCTHCAHCGHELTDSVSVQRGIGPVCSRRGYSEDPAEGDEMQAMIDLAEFPELVEFLTEHYRPLGIRGLVNGLVRAASLNRPRGRGMKEGNYRVHAACCDAIESLGHAKMAQLLRETLIVVRLERLGPDDLDDKDLLPDHRGTIVLRVKRRDEPERWSDQIRAALARSVWDDGLKGHLVPIHHPDDEKRLALSKTVRAGEVISNKRALWDLILRHFPNMIMKNQDGQNVRIRAPKPK